MTWIVWRQQRPVFITLAVALVVAVVTILLLRAGMVADLSARNLLDCVHRGVNACRGQSVGEFQKTWYDWMHIAQGVVIVVPGLIGVFVGAPLFAREYEQGTHALAFTQSVGRTRWMVTKFVVAAFPALVFVAVLQFVVHNWLLAAGELGPFAGGPLYFSTFESQSVAPIAYTLFAYALGAFTGALFMRTLVAMTLTFGLFVVARGVLNLRREHLVEPTRLVTEYPAEAPVIERGQSVVDMGHLDDKGAVVTGSARWEGCTSIDVPEFQACLKKNGVAQSYLDVIPVDQSTTLHVLEGSIFVGFAALFVLGSVWAVRRQV